MMRSAIIALLLLPLAGCGGALTLGNTPSVVLVTVADLRADHVGLPSLTPMLDRSADMSLHFQNATAASAWRLPSLYALMTSRYVDSHSPQGAFGAARVEEPTLAEILAAEGFETAAFVGGPDLTRRSGPARGFDTYLHRPGGTLAELAPLALEWLRFRSGRKTLLWLHVADLTGAARAHDPEAYRSSLRQLDESVRMFLDSLNEEGLSGQGLALVMAGDRGAALSEAEVSTGLRPSDFMIRVPLMMRRAETQPRRVVEPVGLVDVAPTILDWLAVEIPESFQGFSLGNGEPGQDGRTESFSSSAPESGMPLIHALRTTRWKFMEGKTGFELYDLRADPTEQINRIHEHPQRAFELSQRLIRHLSRVRTPARKSNKTMKLSPEMLKRLYEAGYW